MRCGSGLERGDVFITTKCFNDDQGYDAATRALRASLDQLEMDYVDLYLIHWPVPSQDLYVETWKAFIEAQEHGLVRSIGVSNFQPAHLERLVQETGVTPSINQVELHPRLQQQGLRRTHGDLGVVTEAWSPSGAGRGARRSRDHGHRRGPRPLARQVVIRWHLQIGNVVIPKSVTRSGSAELPGLRLRAERREMGSIEELDAGERTGPDPDLRQALTCTAYAWCAGASSTQHCRRRRDEPRRRDHRGAHRGGELWAAPWWSSPTPRPGRITHGPSRA